MAYRLRTRKFLNIHGYEGNAFIVARVEDSTDFEPDERDFWPWTDIELTLSDCSRIIRLSFDLETPGERRNSLRKIRMIVETLQEFEEALQAEAELAAKRMPEGPKDRDPFRR